MIASALKKLLNTQSNFRKKEVSKSSELRIPTDFLRGRQIAYMIYKYFRATGAFEKVQGVADMFTMTLQNDEIQDFDVRWDRAPLQ